MPRSGQTCQARRWRRTNADGAVNVTHRIVPQVQHECLGSLPLQLLQCLSYLAGSGLGKGGEVQETDGGLPLAAVGQVIEAQGETLIPWMGAPCGKAEARSSGMATIRNVAGGKD